MVTISNGVKSFKVPSGSVKAYESAGYHVVGKSKEHSAETPVTGQHKSENDDIDFDGEDDAEGGENQESDADDNFVAELLEKSLSQWSAEETKKFEDTYDKIPNDAKLYITEKLDGNRCIAYHDGIDWQFVSRNGKQMYVKFDMSSFPQNLVFDGEVMTRKQTILSVSRTIGTSCEQEIDDSSTKDFSEASGIINRHSYDKDLVYNIFDIIDTSSTYEQRRAILNELKHNLQGVDTNVRILPIIDVINKRMLEDAAPYYLNKITSQGGEGIMLNIATAKYQHKRTADLIKFKKMYTIDLRVVGWIGGTGKYEGMVGALQCIGEDGDKLIAVDVGTGLSDTQRYDWAVNDDKILGKIVEVGYFSLSQEKVFVGTKHYSLRFPRLIRVREDKNDTNLEI